MSAALFVLGFYLGFCVAIVGVGLTLLAPVVYPRWRDYVERRRAIRELTRSLERIQQ